MCVLYITLSFLRRGLLKNLRLLRRVLIFAERQFHRQKTVTRHVTPEQAAGHTTAKSAVARPAATLKDFFNKPAGGNPVKLVYQAIFS